MLSGIRLADGGSRRHFRFTSQAGEGSLAGQETIVSGMAGRYALALFDLARGAGEVEPVAAGLDQFASLIASNADVARLVKSPVFSAEEQVRAVAAILANIGVDGLAAKFIQLVASKRRLFAVTDMIAGFHALKDKASGVTKASVTVAEPLNDANLAALKAALSEISGSKTIDLAVKIDPNIIGGLVVRLGSRMVDGSLKTKLDSLRRRMKEVG